MIVLENFGPNMQITQYVILKKDTLINIRKDGKITHYPPGDWSQEKAEAGIIQVEKRLREQGFKDSTISEELKALIL